jgi:CubicO group peptidase (beta-lactamase class C family)
MDTTVTTRTSAIDGAIDQALADTRIVGAVVLVARDGRIVYRRAAGLADREAGTPMREDAVFRLASLTKPLVTAAAMRLVELGRIALTDPVTRYLPDFRPALPDGDVPTITLRHLMTHTAGLGYAFMQKPDSPYGRLGVRDGFDEPGISMRDEIDRLARAPLFYSPGTRWQYSLAMDVMGAVLEKVEGCDLEAVLDQYVHKPLGLTELGFDLKPGQRERLATPYMNVGTPPKRIPDAGGHIPFPAGIPMFEGLEGLPLVPARVFDPTSFRSGGAGMNGTASDMMTFLEALRTGGAPILTRESAIAMMTPQIGDVPIESREPGWTFGFGGSVLRDPSAAPTPQSAGTFQWGGVWGHNWFVDPARRITMVSLTNTALEGMAGRYVRDLRGAIYAELGG